MAYEVSSSFISLSENKTQNFLRKFTIANSDFSGRVLRWPRFKRKWDDIRPATTTLSLANGDGGMNFIREDKTIMENECSIDVGPIETGLILYPNDFASGDWLGDATITADTDIAPTSGLQIADTLNDPDTAYRQVNYQVSNFDVNKTYEFKVKVKKDSDTSRFPLFRVAFYGSTNEYFSNTINTQTGAFLAQESAASSDVDVKDSGDYWEIITKGKSVDQSNTACTFYIYPAVATSFGTSDPLATGSIVACEAEAWSYETIELFAGKIRKVKYSDEKCHLTIVDKFQQLSDRQVGDDETPASFTSFYPSSIAWVAVTSYGGYSSIESTNNPDIDYAAYLDWRQIFVDDTVRMDANFNGQKCTEVLRKIARGTASAIFIKNGKISFHRYTLVDTATSVMGASELKNVDVEFDTNHIINKQYLNAGYDVTTKEFAITVFDVNTSSVNSFGLRENIKKDVNLWYVDSASALNMAQRITNTTAEPDDKLIVRTALNGIARQIGETISVTDNFHSIAAAYRVMEYEVDTDKGTTQFNIDRTQLAAGFILDVTSLDGTEILT